MVTANERSAVQRARRAALAVLLAVLVVTTTGCASVRDFPERRATAARVDEATLSEWLATEPPAHDMFLELQRVIGTDEVFGQVDGGFLGIGLGGIYRAGYTQNWSAYDGMTALTVATQWFSTRDAATGFASATPQYGPSPSSQDELVVDAPLRDGLLSELHARFLHGPVLVTFNVQAVDRGNPAVQRTEAELRRLLDTQLAAAVANLPVAVDETMPSWWQDAVIDIGREMQAAIAITFAVVPLLGATLTTLMDPVTWSRLGRRRHRRAVAAIDALGRVGDVVSIEPRARLQRLAGVALTVVRTSFWFGVVWVIARRGLADGKVEVALLLGVRVGLSSVARVAVLGRRGIRRTLAYTFGPGLPALAIVGAGYLMALAMVALAVLASVLSVSLMFSGAAAMLGMEPGSLRGLAIGIGFIAAVLVAAAAVPVRLTRRWSRSLVQRRGRPVRPPYVVFLRAFGDDDLKIRPNGIGAQSSVDRWTIDRRSRFEEVVAWACLRHGAVSAIGDPRSPAPPLGAFRTLVPKEADWHDVVRTQVDGAELVVLVMGLTEGVVWELAHVALTRPDRLVIVLPPGRPVERLEMIDHIFAMSSLPTPPEAVAALDHLLAVVFVDGRPRLYTAVDLDAASYLAAIARASADLASADARPIEIDSSAGDLIESWRRSRPLVTRRYAAVPITRPWYRTPSVIVAVVVWVLNSLLSGVADDGEAKVETTTAGLDATVVVDVGEPTLVFAPVDDGSVVASFMQPPQLRRHRADGTLMWSVDLTARPTDVLVVGDEVWTVDSAADEVHRWALDDGSSFGTVSLDATPNRLVDLGRWITALAPSDQQIVLLTRDGRVDQVIEFDGAPWDAALVGDELIVADVSRDRLSWIDVTTGAEIRTTEGGDLVRDIAVTGDVLYVAAAGESTVQERDVATGELIRLSGVDQGPTGLAVTSEGGVAVICQGASSSLWLLTGDGERAVQLGSATYLADPAATGNGVLVAWPDQNAIAQVGR